MGSYLERKLIDGFEDKKFQNGLNEYYRLWEKGLKKHANKSIKETMIYFDNLDLELQKKIIYKYCEVVCDELVYKNSFERIFRSIDIPYEIKKRMKSILKNDCENNLMPQLRWYYEIFGREEIDANDMLEKAYLHTQKDDKVIQWYFNSFLSRLDWGAHHLPDGCLITKDNCNKLVEKCEELLKKHKIDKGLIDDFIYFKNLYTLWWKYELTDKSVSFKIWSKE